MTLENVRLKVEAFEYLQLPINITEGCIGRLVVQVQYHLWHLSFVDCMSLRKATQPRVPREGRTHISGATMSAGALASPTEPACGGGNVRCLAVRQPTQGRGMGGGFGLTESPSSQAGATPAP